jgi:hypothetical protein
MSEGLILNSTFCPANGFRLVTNVPIPGLVTLFPTKSSALGPWKSSLACNATDSFVRRTTSLSLAWSTRLRAGLAMNPKTNSAATPIATKSAAMFWPLSIHESSVGSSTVECPYREISVGWLVVIWLFRIRLKLRVATLAYADYWRSFFRYPQLGPWHVSSLAHLARRAGDL